MTIYHFGKTMEGINAARRDLPEIFATIDNAMLSSICARRRCILAWVKVPTPRVDGLELAAVDRNARFGEQFKTAVQQSRREKRGALWNGNWTAAPSITVAFLTSF
jgi:hypothetical protein